MRIHLHAGCGEARATVPALPLTGHNLPAFLPCKGCPADTCKRLSSQISKWEVGDRLLYFLPPVYLCRLFLPPCPPLSSWVVGGAHSMAPCPFIASISLQASPSTSWVFLPSCGAGTSFVRNPLFSPLWLHTSSHAQIPPALLWIYRRDLLGK